MLTLQVETKRLKDAAKYKISNEEISYHQWDEWDVSSNRFYHQGKSFNLPKKIVEVSKTGKHIKSLNNFILLNTGRKFWEKTTAQPYLEESEHAYIFFLHHLKPIESFFS